MKRTTPSSPHLKVGASGDAFSVTRYKLSPPKALGGVRENSPCKLDFVHSNLGFTQLSEQNKRF